MRGLGFVLAAAVGAAVVGAATVAAAAVPRRLAVADFTYEDTSGETRDQSAAHGEWLRGFNAALRRDLGAGPDYEVIAPGCDAGAVCPPGPDDPAEIAAAAKAQGAAVLVIGGIHKLSTLIQFARIDVIDLAQDRVVFSRLYTFRGDDEQAWRRAEQFIHREIRDHAGPASAP